MAQKSKSFTALGVGPQLFLKRGNSFTLDVSGTFSGSVVLEYTHNGGITWIPQESFTAAASRTVKAITSASQTAYYRFRCDAYVSGTIVTILEDAFAEKITPFAFVYSSVTVLPLSADSFEEVVFNQISKIKGFDFDSKGLAPTKEGLYSIQFDATASRDAAGDRTVYSRFTKNSSEILGSYMEESVTDNLKSFNYSVNAIIELNALDRIAVEFGAADTGAGFYVGGNPGGAAVPNSCSLKILKL